MATAKKQTPSVPKATDTEGGTVQALQVVTKRDGFRRAGREWHGTTTVPLEELTEEQFLKIQAEPMLVSMLIEVPAESVAELGAADGAPGT